MQAVQRYPCNTPLTLLLCECELRGHAVSRLRAGLHALLHTHTTGIGGRGIGSSSLGGDGGYGYNVMMVDNPHGTVLDAVLANMTLEAPPPPTQQHGGASGGGGAADAADADGSGSGAAVSSSLSTASRTASPGVAVSPCVALLAARVEELRAGGGKSVGAGVCVLCVYVVCVGVWGGVGVGNKLRICTPILYTSSL